MLKNSILILLNLLLLSELSLCESDDSSEIPCKITYAETLFKQFFGDFVSTPPNDTETQEKFNKAKGLFRGIFPGKNI